MAPGLLKRILSKFRPSPSTQPDPQFIAQQLRKPSGKMAGKVSAKMNEANAPLFNLTLETMQLHDGDSVLEIGFGGGRFFEKLFQRADGLNVCGIDYSSAMVKEARARNQSTIDTGNLQLKLADSADIPFPKQSFDHAYCNMVIYFWDQPEIHLREIRRVLKPGGMFYTGMRSAESMQMLPFVEYGFNLYDRDQWSRILAQNGFSVVGIKNKKDPATKIEGQMMRLESICLAAKKIDR